MSIEVVDFSTDFSAQAAELVHEAQIKEFKAKAIGHEVSPGFCREKIEAELAGEGARAYMLLERGLFLGFAIGVIDRDPLWGDSGWVHLGGWGIAESRKDLLNLLYQRVGDDFVKLGISQHYFQVWDNDIEVLEIMNNLGFAKEQTYACLELGQRADNRPETSSFTARRGRASDKNQLSNFSRLIAEHQMKSPCFASAPAAYLEALDEGFDELLDDAEADVFVVEQDESLAGYQVYYEAGQSLIIPAKSAELAVSGVSEEYRGKGAGYVLTQFGLDEQLKAGYSHAVTDWRCANMLSGKFWRSVGFIPNSHRLVRRIDPLLKKQ